VFLDVALKLDDERSSRKGFIKNRFSSESDYAGRAIKPAVYKD
jgi:hypothetical protein